jgi:hypothetical protein
LKDVGFVTLSSIERIEIWRRCTARYTFKVDELLPTLLENFGKRVRASAIEEMIAETWSGRPELLAVERLENDLDLPSQGLIQQRNIEPDDG